LNKLSWYMARLKHMQPAEVLWRVGSVARLPLDYVAMERARSKHRYQPDGDWWKREGYPLRPHREGGEFDQIRLFDLRFPADFSPDWHRDYRHDKTAPRKFSRQLDIRDSAVVGDIKYIWELSRHQHLSAIAYSNRPDAEAIVVAGLQSWMEENPFLVGVNWTSSLELASRLISWALLYPTVRPSFDTDRKLRETFAASVYLHLSAIRNKLSLYSSANNHLLGELAGLYMGSVCFPWWPECEGWRRFSWALLEREVQLQFTPEGINREQAMSYQLFTLELLILAMIIAQNVGDTVGPIVHQRVLAALHYLDKVATLAGELPLYGDSDDARGFLFSEHESALEVVMQLGALFFKEPRFARRSPRLTAAAQALMPSACEQLHELAAVNTGHQTRSDLFRDAGIAVIDGVDCKLVMDVGALGYTSIAAHGHADALSVMLAAGDEYILVDSGTYAYHSHPDWRSYFRGTAAHNTVRVDCFDQSVMSGRFLWSSKANVRLIDFAEDDQVVRISAEHDGYNRLADPVLHRRNVTFQRDRRIVTIEDVLSCNSEHGVELHWHLSEHAETIKESSRGVRVLANGHAASFTFSGEDFELEVITGAVAPILGWRSSAFNQKSEIPTLRFAGRVTGTTSIFTSIHLTEADPKAESRN
jgi:hypothetical protein